MVRAIGRTFETNRLEVQNDKTEEELEQMSKSGTKKDTPEFR